MKATSTCKSYLCLQALSALVLSITLTACGEGFHARNTNNFSNDGSAYFNTDDMPNVQVPTEIASEIADDAEQERAPASTDSHPELQDDTQDQFALDMKSANLNSDAQQRVLER